MLTQLETERTSGDFYVDRDGRTQLRIGLNFTSDPTGPDVYTATVFGGDGAMLFTHQTTVERYETSYPNGRDCPGKCVSASVDETSEDSEP